jgi:hypothetical protein
LYNVAPYNFTYFQPVASFFSTPLSHLGTDVTGIYLGEGGTLPPSSYIVDLQNGSRRYYIENTSSYFVNVTSAINNVITGTFNCILLDGQNRIAASGSFKAKQ